MKRSFCLLIVLLSLFSTSVFASFEDNFDDFEDSENTSFESYSSDSLDEENEEETSSFLFLHGGSSGFVYSGSDDSKFEEYSLSVGMTENFDSNLNIGISAFFHKPIKDKVSDNVEISYITYSNYAIMLTGFYNIPMEMEFIPYVSAGLGMSQATIDLVKEVNKEYSQTFKTKALAYELGAGIFYKFTPKVSFDLNVKYTRLGHIDLSKIDLDPYKITATTIGGGVRVNF